MAQQFSKNEPESDRSSTDATDATGQKVIDSCKPFWKRGVAAADPTDKDLFARRAAAHAGKQFAPAPYNVEGSGNEHFSNLHLVGTILTVPLVLTLLVASSFSVFYWAFFLIFTALPTFAFYNLYYTSTAKPIRPQLGLPGRPIEDYLEIKDASLKTRYNGRNKIPMETFFEAYFDEKIDIKDDMLTLLEARHDFIKFAFTWGQCKFFMTQWIPELLAHTRKQDEEQVQEHYDRGDDFYAAFREYYYFLFIVLRDYFTKTLRFLLLSPYLLLKNTHSRPPYDLHFWYCP